MSPPSLLLSARHRRAKVALCEDWSTVREQTRPSTTAGQALKRMTALPTSLVPWPLSLLCSCKLLGISHDDGSGTPTPNTSGASSLLVATVLDSTRLGADITGPRASGPEVSEWTASHVLLRLRPGRHRAAVAETSAFHCGFTITIVTIVSSSSIGSRS